MQYFIPQAIFIVSLATIILIVLRRIPEVTVREEDEPKAPGGAPAASPTAALVAARVRERTWHAVRKLGAFASEAKDYTARAQYLQRFMKVLAFKNLTARLKPPVVVITKNLMQQAKNLVQQDDFPQAEQAYIRIIERDPSNEEAYENLGKLYLERKKYKEALEVYEYLVKHHPHDDRYWNKLGVAQYQLANYKGAVDSYSTAIRLNPKVSNRYVNLSLSHASLGQLAEAEAAAEKASQLDPNNPEYILLLADCRIERGKNQEAKELLERVLELEPTSDAARERLMKLKF
ncbi:MAG: hypothetical protein A2722_02410 [Candidatus Doudnabacteria bacterium RIFCSPHIGHO2_01_FULL_50_11]|uniref:Tetratricopeptide repeat protein n=1 Tax=Candidatus Doudnabacteria bacterium RIFCSPHIGHO2_01_FULL_50_11 TaxID=1817828 RepID=A0A1F5PFR4_9BACT|nr:MAG: hypothetical protein A2722_02410 [Candidatus Doudnabacteria bacterium RIFCSPHIGHO2_01_FULL_50_11]HLC44417.1 tetratricopeptide repeat protein [Patescibacteria group bacterium]